MYRRENESKLPSHYFNSMKAGTPLIIANDMTMREQSWVIEALAQRLQLSRIKRSDEHLFGALPPHIKIKQLLDFNCKCLEREFSSKVRTILSNGNAKDYYYSSDTVLNDISILGDEIGWKSWTLLSSSWKRGQYSWEHGNINPHHLYPRSRGGTSKSENIRSMPRIPHDDFHIIFQNLTPMEQIDLMLRIHRSDFRRDFREYVREIIYDSDQHDEIYIRWIRWGTGKKWMGN